jgi:hypothetical protein
MRIPALAATALAALLLLSSCAPSSNPDAHRTSTPSPTASMPAFLSSTQLDSDVLPAGIADAIGVGDASTRLQGEWGGHEVFLALKNSSSVCLVTGTPDVPSSWQAGCGAGNEVVTVKATDGGMVKYLPMSTSATPEGWTRLSDYVFAM